MKNTIKYYLKYWYYIIVIFGLLFGQAMMDLTLPDYMSKIISEGVITKDIPLTLFYGGIMLAYAFGSAALCALVVFLAARVGTKTAKDLRSAVFARVSEFSGSEFDKLSVSTLITRSTNDINQLQMFSVMFIRLALYAPMMAIGGILKAIQKSGSMDMLVWIIVIAVAFLLVAIVILVLIAQPKFMGLQRLTDKLNMLAREGLNGMMVIRAFNTVEHEEKRFDKTNVELTKTGLFVNRAMAVFFPLLNAIMFGVMAAVVWVTSFFAANVEGMANMMAFIQYAMQVIISFMLLTMVFVTLPRAYISGKRIGEVLQTYAKIKDSSDAKTLKNPKGIIEFKNVSFAYPGSEEKVLDNINFVAKPSQVVAIIGGTGSGKSTLVSLLARLYDPTEGVITIDDEPINNFTLKSLRQSMAFVPQKSVLLSGTIASNIKYACEDASFEQMERAAQIAQCEFINNLQDGFDSEIAQGGTNVSGGQRQRLAIARAVIKDSSVMIFDDSFSALDFKTDSNLRKALKENCQNTTFIIVAQRVGTIMNADKILVLDNGKIVGEGTHKQLLTSCPEYKEIAMSQLSGEEAGV